MYSHEIERLIEERKGLLTADEYLNAFDPKISTQVNYMKFVDPETGIIEATTYDGYYFKFKVYLPKENVKVKKL